MVEYCNCQPKIMGLSLVVMVCTRIEKLAKSFDDMTSSGSTIVEHCPHYPKVVGSRRTLINTLRE